ncbi:putative acetyltransferase [Kribbella aluminosa]|uniref:Acetyltransferase n=1 Tax=Kribbella aluminosa TaxID=416017 RepID=A0ABS4UUK0_9ACTN|nr:GNAT family N-acetyltransferase [Kribbella aluminosa]MBP2355308.1 putative acetyltransferase [Kribbella aluminosa]
MSEIEVRAAGADEFGAVQAVFSAAMMFDPGPENELDQQLFEADRTLVATDGSAVVGTVMALTRDLSVPGAVVDAAHVTGVGVLATHRRRGLMARLIGQQLRDVPEAIAALWATESGIYGRFGYAACAWATNYEIDLHRVGPTNDRIRPGALGVLTIDEAVKELPSVLRRLQEQRPGVSGRSGPRWQKRLQDNVEQRGGQTAQEILVHRAEDGTIDGYALWRGKMNWLPVGPANEVSVEEIAAPDPTAYRELWQHLLTMDLCAKLNYGHGAMDEPLQQLVTTPTALERRVGESLWVRVTDVPRALRQRQYSVPVEVVLEVRDDLIEANAGRFRLTADGSSVTCERTDDTPDLSLSVTELGAVYLGERPLTEFAATGRVVEHTSGALHRTTAAFRWPVSPVSLEIF